MKNRSVQALVITVVLIGFLGCHKGRYSGEAEVSENVVPEIVGGDSFEDKLQKNVTGSFVEIGGAEIQAGTPTLSKSSGIGLAEGIKDVATWKVGTDSVLELTFQSPEIASRITDIYLPIHGNYYKLATSSSAVTVADDQMRIVFQLSQDKAKIIEYLVGVHSKTLLEIETEKNKADPASSSQTLRNNLALIRNSEKTDEDREKAYNELLAHYDKSYERLLADVSEDGGRIPLNYANVIVSDGESTDWDWSFDVTRLTFDDSFISPYLSVLPPVAD